MAEILNIDFNQLPRPTRERFIAISHGKAGPEPIFQQRASAAGGCGWFLLLGSFGALSVSVVVVDFGKPYQATQPIASAAAYVLLFFLASLGLLGLIRSFVRKNALPFRTGSYLFAADTVIARDRNLKILSAREVASLQPVHHHRNGIYTHTVFSLTYSDGTRETFFVSGKPRAEQAMQRLRAEGAQVAEAMARRDARQLYPLDPLFEARMVGFQPTSDTTGPLAKSLPAWTKRVGLLALGVACVVGPITYGLRNLASDELAFNNAERSYEYLAYLRHGWRHKEEVQAEFLPRAQLKEAIEKPEVAERITAISAVGTGKLIPAVRQEVDAALKVALHAAFDKASAAGTVSALREFQKTYPQAEDVPAAKIKIHLLFEKTLADFKPHASKPGSVPFVASLLDYLEKNDSPPVEVRFRRHNGKTLELADKVLARDAAGSASFASASSHFEPKDAATREDAVVAAMQRGFGAVFPTDVLALDKGAELDAADGRVPSTGKPSVFVDYTVGWSGSTYSDPKEGRHFVGIVFDFDVLMTVPGDGQSLKLKFKVLPPQTFTVSYDTFTNPAFGAAINAASQGPSDSLVYEVMALRAFDELSSRIQDELFVAEKTADAKP
jgi:hypothetical protein